VDEGQLRLSEQIDQATQRVIDVARVITEPDLREPSLLPGWTRAHVLAHLARNADAMRNLLIGARTGRSRPGYASAEAREAGIEAGSRLTAIDLTTELADSAMALRAVARQLPDDAWDFPVQMPGSGPFPAHGLLTRRLVEVELHHCDLWTGYVPADWPTAFAAMELAEPMRSQREDRLKAAGSVQAPKLRAPRPPAPYNPAQRLPGSWIGNK
jgi:maleylpyruvate isomerase